MSNKERTRLGILFGGRSSEHEVSIMSARSVLAALNQELYEIIPIGITREGDWMTGEDALAVFESGRTENLTQVTLIPGTNGGTLYKLEKTSRGTALEAVGKLDVIFPVLHGTFGEDGTIQGLLELNRIPYVGAGVLGSSVCMDKALFKDVMRAHGLPVLPAIVVTREQVEKDQFAVLDKVEQFNNYPVFIKPSNGGSSVGITKCRNRSDVLEGLLDAMRFDRRILVEKGLAARELEVSVLGTSHPQASLPGEIIPSAEYYSYEAKYFDDSTSLVVPANLDPEIVRAIQSLAVKAYTAADCEGMSRVDFLMERETGKVFISEINTIPGFTKISMYPKLWEASGLPYDKLLDRLIELALERKGELDKLEFVYRRGE